MRPRRSRRFPCQEFINPDKASLLGRELVGFSLAPPCPEAGQPIESFETPPRMAGPAFQVKLRVPDGGELGPSAQRPSTEACDSSCFLSAAEALDVAERMIVIDVDARPTFAQNGELE